MSDNKENESTEDILGGLGIEVILPDAEAFLKVKETLTRVGVSSAKSKTLYQSCHILHKRGRYFILHFKELFKLDGKASSMDDTDLARRNTIVKLLNEWGLLTIRNKTKEITPTVMISQIKIIPHKEKSEWVLIAKYSIGSHSKTGK
jgi:translational regulator